MNHCGDAEMSGIHDVVEVRAESGRGDIGSIRDWGPQWADCKLDDSYAVTT